MIQLPLGLYSIKEVSSTYLFLLFKEHFESLTSLFVGHDA